MYNKFLLILFLTLINTYFYSNVAITKEIKIIKKINNELITNIDVEKEMRYLILLNQELTKLKKKEIKKLATESLEREKIKILELKKNKTNEEKNLKILENTIKNIYSNLNFTNSIDFENYLLENNFDFDEFRKKIMVEIQWNSLIVNKFQNQVNIDIDKIKNELKKNIINQKIIEYDLHEIVFQSENNAMLEKTKKEIELSIINDGIEMAASKHSLSDTSKLGGYIGKINENNLSEIIKFNLNDLKAGEFTKPINIGGNFLILYIKNKIIKDININEEDVLKNRIAFERRKQFENFSQIYFKKISIDTRIDEF